jgi:hypothetical protein
MRAVRGRGGEGGTLPNWESPLCKFISAETVNLQRERGDTHVLSYISVSFLHPRQARRKEMIREIKQPTGEGRENK